MFSLGKSLVFIAALAVSQVSSARLTLDQMDEMADPIKLVCIPKTKVSEESLVKLRNTQIDDLRETKCYVNCVLEMMQTMKKGKLQFDGVMKVLDTMMPEELVDDSKRAFENCKDVSVGIKDPCESAYTLMKCLFKENPKFYFP